MVSSTRSLLRGYMVGVIQKISTFVGLHHDVCRVCETKKEYEKGIFDTGSYICCIVELFVHLD